MPTTRGQNKRLRSSSLNGKPKPFKKTKLLKRNKKGKSSIFALRSITGNYKTSVLVNTDNLELKDPAKLPIIDQNIQTEYKDVGSHVELKTISYNKNGSPEKAIAEDGTAMFPYLDTGLVVYFRDKKPKTPHKSPKIKKNFNNNPQVKNIASPPKDAKKQVDYVLTPKELKKVEKEIVKNNNRRKISQNKAMVKKGVSEKKGSASDYVKLIITRTPKRQRKKRPSHNWGHFEAHSLGGSKTQHKNNLAAISTHTNTLQITQDEANKKLLQHYSEVKGEVSSSLIEGTHVAIGRLTQITQTVDFSIKKEYHSQERTCPLAVIETYDSKMIEAIVNAHHSTPPPVSKMKHSILFSKKDKRSAPQKAKKKLNFNSP